MAKDAYYFSHDCNSRNDPKTSALISEYGMEGYGFFWIIIEMISEQDGYKMKKFPKLYEAISKQCLTDASKIGSMLKSIINDYDLLQEDEKYIWSESLLRRMQEKEKKRNIKVESGRKGGINSGLSRNKTRHIEATLKQNEAVLEANEPKESKVKQSKIITTTTVAENSFEELSNYFFELTGRMSNSNDCIAIQEALRLTTDYELIKKVMEEKTQAHKKRNPNETIKAFAYYLSPLKDEVAKTEYIKTVKIPAKQNQNIITMGEHSYDLSDAFNIK